MQEVYYINSIEHSSSTILGISETGIFGGLVYSIFEHYDVQVVEKYNNRQLTVSPNCLIGGGLMKLYYVMFIVISILSLALGAANYVNEKATIASGEQADATLTRWIADPHYGTGDFCPVYEYTTKAGQSHSYIGDNCASQPDATLIGSQEHIYFDPKTPETVGSFGLFGSEGSGLVVGIIGFVFFSFFWIVPLFVIPIVKRVIPARKSI